MLKYLNVEHIASYLYVYYALDIADQRCSLLRNTIIRDGSYA